MAHHLVMSEEDTSSYMTFLINSGVLHAQIETTDDQKILRFSRDSAQEEALRSDEQLRDELLASTSRIKILQQHIEENDRRLELSKGYVEHVRIRRKNKDERQVAEEETICTSSFAPQFSDDDDLLMEIPQVGR